MTQQMNSMIDVVILGASGYGGGELLRLLSGHPQVRSIAGTSRRFAGKPFAAAHPNLRGVVEGSFAEAADWKALAAGAGLPGAGLPGAGLPGAGLPGAGLPVVFTALPHGELAKRLQDLERSWAEVGLQDRLTLVDLSGDFRLADPAVFAQAYGQPHPHPQRLGSFVYGLPEWNRTALKGATRIASAGCFATALQLALLPLRDLQLGFLAVSAATGSSGSGMTPSDTTHHPTRAQDFRAYKALAHQHQPEVEGMMAACGIRGRLAFVPHSAPMVRGIFATLQFELPAGLEGAGLKARAQAACDDSPFLRYVEGSPRVGAVTGSNFCDLSAAASHGSGCIMTALDNLVKGMAGQAVQCMNLALGLDERAGLMRPGCWPG